MKFTIKLFLFFICLTMIFSCIRRRTYVLNTSGKIKRYNRHIDRKIEELCWGTDKNFLFFYPAQQKDTIELNIALAKFIPIIKTKRLSNSLKSHKIVLLTDSSGVVETNQSGFRDFSYGLTFNLNKGEIHFETCSGF